MTALALMVATMPMDSADFNVGGELLRVIASLCGVIVLILAAGFLSRRVQRRAGGGGRRIRCVETFAMGARERLLLIDADGKRLLIGVGQGGMRTLHVYEQTPAERASMESVQREESDKPAVAPFSELLARWKGRS